MFAVPPVFFLLIDLEFLVSVVCLQSIRPGTSRNLFPFMLALALHPQEAMPTNSPDLPTRMPVPCAMPNLAAPHPRLRATMNEHSFYYSLPITACAFYVCFIEYSELP